MVERRAPKAGKGHTLNARITAETRSALEAEASRSGRSLSQVAEVWLEQARFLSELSKSGGGVAEALASMARYAALVRDEFGDPEESLAAREALRIGWRRIARKALPFTVDRSEEAVAFRKAERQMRAAATEARQQLVHDERHLQHPDLVQHLRVIALAPTQSAHWYADALSEMELQSARFVSPDPLAELREALAQMITAAERLEALKDQAMARAMKLAHDVAWLDYEDDAIDTSWLDRGEAEAEGKP
jgi:hypothetical protein